MDLKNKLDYAKSYINSIARHDDEDMDVRNVVLDELVQHITDEKTAAQARNHARLVTLGIVGAE